LFSVSGLWPWLALFGLGAFHGINPAMGWLFAVALGLQEQKRAAVLRALLPIALGHALSIGIVIATVLVARISLPHQPVKNCRRSDSICFRPVSSLPITPSQLGGYASRFW
jgi:hypothetical protein